MHNIKIRAWLYKAAPLLIFLLLMVLPLFSGPANVPAVMHRQFLLHMLITNVLLLLFFYGHTYLAYPLLKRPRGFGLYIGVLLALLIVYVLVFEQLSSEFMPPPHFGIDKMARPGGPPPGYFGNDRPRGFFPVVSPLIALLCSFCYIIILNQVSREELINEREMIHLRTELNFLRSQVSPHFLFNVLNSMVALVRRKSDKLEPVIIQLSQLMRYMLYETDDQPVLLEKEIAYLQNYIQLQMLRFGDSIDVQAKFPDNTLNYTIAPMLLIPLVENAFKHGTGMMKTPVIEIELSINESEKSIDFRVVNQLNLANTSKDEQQGIGLANVKRRLELLYSNQHKLEIVKGEDSFVANLSLQVKIE